MKITAAILAMLLPCITFAHHSRANFDDSLVVELTGTIVDYTWRNPHVYFEIQTDDDAGVSQT